MKIDNWIQIKEEMKKTFGKLSYKELPVSDYNKEYIDRMYPAISHYIQIFSDCLAYGIENSGLPPQEITMVDYGGGAGFLSLMAKKTGIKKVIYIDLNPDSVQTIHTIKERLGIGPDIILEGDSDTLRHWCKENEIHPDLLIATDLIEHIYDLNSFFSDLSALGRKMQMIFTTASTPYNPYVKRKLRKMMQGCESGDLEIPNYLHQRKEFIRQNQTGMNEDELQTWAKQTRGMRFDDIQKVLLKKQMPIPADPYNTCDPMTGNWTERILPVSVYRELLKPYGYQLKIEKGYYNTERKKPFFRFFCKCINSLIRYSGKGGYVLAPFLFLIVEPE